MQRRAALLSSAALAVGPVAVSASPAVAPLKLLRPEALLQDLEPKAAVWREPEEEDSLSIDSPGSAQSAKAARWLSIGDRIHSLVKDLSNDMEAQATSTQGWHTLGERMAFLFDAEAEENEREWDDNVQASKASAWRSLGSRMQSVVGVEGEGAQGMSADEVGWEAPHARFDQVLAAVEAHSARYKQQLSSSAS